MNTLPNAPRNTASSVISAKYIHESPACASAAHSMTDSSVNIPPNTPTISTANMIRYAAVPALERARPFLAS